MGKLKNAPLLEVIFELRWKMSSAKHWEKYSFLSGDLYSLMKDDYPNRELLFPGEIPHEMLIDKPMYRFRNENQYPLFQIGPGLLTLNTIEAAYEWDVYYKQIVDLSEKLFDTYSFSTEEEVRPSLAYYDFFELDWENENVLEYISSHLNLNIEQHFYETNSFPNSFNWGIGYKTDIGNLVLRIDAGANNNNIKGLIVQIQINGFDKEADIDSLINWLNEAHAMCSSLFKDMTRGKLYESFIT